MPSFNDQNAECHIYTFKEGVFSAMGHDLKLEAKGLKVDVSPKGDVRATVDSTSIEPLCAMERGREARGALKAKDLERISGHLHDDVLDTGRFPTISFHAPAGALDPKELIGNLTLKGISAPIKLILRRDGPDVVASARILQPNYDIPPFKALLGAIKVKPEVRVEIRLKGASADLESLA